jgi:chorismate mutase
MADAGDPAALEALRVQIDSVDAGIVELLHQRARIVARIGLAKGMRNASKRRSVSSASFSGCASWPGSHGIEPGIVEGIYRSLIEALTDLPRRILSEPRPRAR